MRRLMGSLAILGSILPSLAYGQVGIDMASVTCAQYLAMPPGQARVFSAWMSGYFSASKDLNVVDFGYVERNRKVVETYCKKRPGETLMSAIQKNAR